MPTERLNEHPERVCVDCGLPTLRPAPSKRCTPCNGVAIAKRRHVEQPHEPIKTKICAECALEFQYQSSRAPARCTACISDRQIAAGDTYYKIKHATRLAEIAATPCRECGNTWPVEGARRINLCHGCYANVRKRGARGWRLWKYYKMTIAEFDGRLAEQNGKCASCQQVSTSWHVDHDHACCPGEITCGLCVRAILCPGCNSAAGHVKDDWRIARMLGDYLQRTRMPTESVKKPGQLMLNI